MVDDEPDADGRQERMNLTLTDYINWKPDVHTMTLGQKNLARSMRGRDKCRGEGRLTMAVKLPKMTLDEDLTDETYGHAQQGRAAQEVIRNAAD